MAEFHLECPDTCSLRPPSPVGALASPLFADGVTYRAVAAAIVDAGYPKPSMGTLTRHKRHIAVHAQVQADEPALRKATNIEILEAIIQKGFANSKNWKPTINDTMKAMDQWFRLTQGNPFDELLDTLASASLGEDDPAVGLPDEHEAMIGDD